MHETLQTCYPEVQAARNSPNMLPWSAGYMKLSKHVTLKCRLHENLQTCYPEVQAAWNSPNMLPWSAGCMKLSKHVTLKCRLHETLQTSYPEVQAASPNMLPTMIHGKAFLTITWQPTIERAPTILHPGRSE